MSTTAPALPASVQAEAEQAERLAQQGQTAAAARLYERVLAVVPDYSRALSFFAMQAYLAGDLPRARDWIERASRGQPRVALIEANRALILRAMGDADGALAAFEAALALDPDFVPARLDAAALLEAMGRRRDANAHYRAALARLPPAEALPPALRERVEHAQRALAEEEQELERWLQARLAPLQSQLDEESRARFDECYQILRGRQKPMLPRPGFMYFPKLPPLTFYPRQQFPWAEQIEAATDAIRAELQSVLAEHDERFMPYVQKHDVAPGSVWEPLNFRHDWDVFFLYNQGERVEKHCQACPATVAALDALPLVRIPGRGPTAFFSRLRPGTHIPPHHGATNTRLIVHLPLIVPPGCGFRVGNDVREWRPGELLIFDDTIEHEAWNHGDQTRVVLIFDIWNPFLTEAERELVTAVTAAMAEYYPDRQHVTDP
ncbi:aspartyl/asparaginyl beta-hydroxylase domain-containing protein [Rehaibacterium terrae]|uniref:Aspartyl/asparaginyl beta-hydroxylase (Cupin superfamily) n=1 Tax=Rehaibacterium terrae TaxID=1341696 RepID=A0A7W7XZ52_9GAMM|nr:aspartyl/asparaginyl beta-hydroxylase domain-containing protein [Rehaibacterium terrae]MBB5015119.1 aspartyl/asparaginyl beta-hydroxylase (cupin superfamily) [Rehaibacterium terrae]